MRNSGVYLLLFPSRCSRAKASIRTHIWRRKSVVKKGATAVAFITFQHTVPYRDAPSVSNSKIKCFHQNFPTAISRSCVILRQIQGVL